MRRHGLSTDGCGPAVDDDPRAFLRQRLGDGVADARGAAADEGELVLELQIHLSLRHRR